MRGIAIISAACAMALPAAGEGQGLADPAAAFGARESIQNISMSPDGRRIAYVAPHAEQGARIFTVDLATGASVQSAAVDGRTQRLSSCGWVTNERLLCALYAMRPVQTDVFGAGAFAAFDIDGTNIVPIRGVGAVIDWASEEPGSVLMTSQARVGNDVGLGVVRVDTRREARFRNVESPVVRAGGYLSDGRGRIRIYGVRRMHGETRMLSDQVEYRYRQTGSDQWRSFGLYSSMTRDGMRPLAIDADRNAVYVLDKVDGRRALFRVMLDGTMAREMLVSHDRVDVDDVVRLGRGGRVIGATYAEEARRIVYFDESYRALAEQLSRAIPNLPLIYFAGASDDESILLIWAGSDRDPGRYYTYERATRRLNEIMLVRPELERVPMAQVRAVEFPAADGTMIPAYLTLPPSGGARGLPTIVMPHGGPGARDEWGFDWLAQYYAHRGYAVLQPNFRGSAGYGDDWFLQNGFQSWRTAIGDVNDAGRWLVREGTADPARLAIVGWSYGGYAALQSGVLEPDLYRAIVAIAPVTDLNLLREEARGWTDFRMMRDFIGTGPHITQGSPAANAATIRAPVLLFHGDLDTNVSIRHARLMESRLDAAGRATDLVTYPGLDHHLDDGSARADMLRRSDAFLRQAMNIPAVP